MNANVEAAPRTKLHELIEGFSTAMLVTFAADGGLHARPMAIAELDENNMLWFVSGKDSLKTTEIERDSRAHVTCQSDDTFLSIRGRAILVEDRRHIERLWREPFRIWFPHGVDDPNLVLIAFQPSSAEYWDNEGFNRLTYLWESAKAYVTGTTPKVREPEQHGVISV